MKKSQMKKIGFIIVSIIGILLIGTATLANAQEKTLSELNSAEVTELLEQTNLTPAKYSEIYEVYKNDTINEFKENYNSYQTKKAHTMQRNIFTVILLILVAASIAGIITNRKYGPKKSSIKVTPDNFKY